MATPANWGKNYTPPAGLELYPCEDPIISLREPIPERRNLIEGIYWLDKSTDKMWFNLDGEWTHYNPTGISVSPDRLMT